MFKKLFFSNYISLGILEILNFISYIFLLFARLNILLLIVAMLFYLFHDKWINTFDLFIDYWIKYQFVIIDKCLFDIFSYVSLIFICGYLEKITDKYSILESN